MSNKDINKPKMNMPRFNLTWLYMFIAMTIAYLYFTSDDSAGIDRQLTYTEFKDMVNKGYANKIIAYNDNTVDMFIKPEYVKEVFRCSVCTESTAVPTESCVEKFFKWREHVHKHVGKEHHQSDENQCCPTSDERVVDEFLNFLSHCFFIVLD